MLQKFGFGFIRSSITKIFVSGIQKYIPEGKIRYRAFYAVWYQTETFLNHFWLNNVWLVGQ